MNSQNEAEEDFRDKQTVPKTQLWWANLHLQEVPVADLELGERPSPCFS